MSIQPCLNFEGRCEEAVDFYRRALGAEVTMLLRHEETPERVLHARLRIGETTIIANDGCGSGRPSFDGFSLAITAPDGVRAGLIFAALGDGGRVRLPEPRVAPVDFGTVVDRFGVTWTVTVAVAA